MLICGSHFTRIVKVIWTFACIEKLLSPCNFCSSNFVVSHYGMSGLCIMALAWHRKMLETAHDGLGQCSGCDYCDKFTCSALDGISRYETDCLASWSGMCNLQRLFLNLLNK